VVFVVAIFFIKSNSSYKNSNEGKEGLVVNTEILGDLLNKDSDKDGILDWEENLWNTDPNSKDTDGDGEGDKAEIEKLKIENGLNQPPQDPKTLTRTDKFSQELFTTVAALSQSGELDQMSVEQISESLKEQIQTSSVKIVFTTSDIIVSNDNSIESIKAYDKAITELTSKNQLEVNPLSIFQESIMVDGEINSEILMQLDPLIEKLEETVAGYQQINVPGDLVHYHLNLMNSLQRFTENLIDIRNFESDGLIALGAISKYEENTDALENATKRLNDFLLTKLNS
jgi:hypothetical protein